MHDHSARIDPNLSRPRPVRPMGRVTPPLIDAFVPRSATRYEEDHHRRVRPLDLQKMIKKYDSLGDPHDHMVAYRQAVHVEQVKDTNM